MSLAEKIAQLATPTPAFRDPEDNLDVETVAKVVEYHTSDDEEVAVKASTLRLKNVPLLSESSSRYAGKRTSRKDLEASFSAGGTPFDDDYSEDSRCEDNSSESGVELTDDDEWSGKEDRNDFGSNKNVPKTDNDDGDDVMLQRFKDKFKQLTNVSLDEEQSLDDDYEDHNEDDDDDNVNDDDDDDNNVNDDVDNDDDDNDDDDNDSEISNQEEESNESTSLNEQSLEVSNAVKTFSHVRLNDEVDKGVAVRAQLNLWDSLLECRIKLQKVLLTANQLPQFDVWPAFVDKGGGDFTEKARASQKAVKRLLDDLLELQTQLFMENDETKYILNSESAITKDKWEEEIASDTEEEDEQVSRVDTGNGLKRKLAFTDYPEFLKKRCVSFESYRNAVINTWNDKTILTTGKVGASFAGFEQSALKQIEQILCDKDRLIRRTQLKRATYHLLGKRFSLQIEDEQGEKTSGQEAVLKQDFHLKDIDAEIFDDNDFYHQLLRELIERKTLILHDPQALGRQWLEIQKLRSKMRKNASIVATKDRNIRYDVHSKLVNFMAPIENVTMLEESRNDLFRSLFSSVK